MLPTARWPGPQCPERGECLEGLEEVGVGVLPEGMRVEVARPASVASVAAAVTSTPIPHLPYPLLPGSNSPGSHCQFDREGSSPGRCCPVSPTDFSQATPSLSPPNHPPPV